MKLRLIFFRNLNHLFSIKNKTFGAINFCNIYTKLCKTSAFFLTLFSLLRNWHDTLKNYKI